MYGFMGAYIIVVLCNFIVLIFCNFTSYWNTNVELVVNNDVRAGSVSSPWKKRTAEGEGVSWVLAATDRDDRVI